MTCSGGLTDPAVDHKAGKLLSMFPLSWTTGGHERRWYNTMDSDGDESLRSRGCKVDHEESRRNVNDPGKKIVPNSHIFSKS